MKNFFKLDKPTFSFEIFPPKGKGDLSQIFNTVDALASLDPDLISVTYGAGGSSRENTAEIASRIQRDYAIPALAHLTCIGSTRDEMRATLDALRDKGIQNILAMRGDIVGEGTKDFSHASDLIKFINENFSGEITLEGLAERFGYTKTYLSEQFNRFAGMPLREYINRRRINEFYRRKRDDPAVPACRIAAEVGFKSLNTFYRALHKYPNF